MLDAQRSRWQPDYHALTSWRATALESLRAYPASGRGAYLRYCDDPVAFIDHWADTVDPRLATIGAATRVPFALFPRQRELIQFFHA
jgi:phage terminase large subunit